MGGQSVARPALFLFTVSLRTPYDYEKIPGRVFWRDQITIAELFCGCVYMGRPLRAHVLIEIPIAHFDGRAVRGAPGVARAI